MTLVSELLWKFGQQGYPQTQAAILDLQYKQYKLVESTATLRTTYLYLAFGLLAAGSMISRVGNKLVNLTKEWADAYSTLEWETKRVTLLMGLEGDEAKALMADLQTIGRVTEYTSAQAAETARVFAMSGKRFTEAGEAIEAITPVLALATIGQISHTEAARLSIDAMNQFGYAMSDLGGIIDVFANAARLSNVEVSELAVSMSYAGTVANQYNATLADTVTFMSLAADAGIRGGRAGRYFREGIDRLAKSLAVENKELLTEAEFVDRVRRAENELNVSIFDSYGNFTNLEDAINVLNKAFSDLQPAERDAVLRAQLGSIAWGAWAGVMDRAEKGTDEYRKTVHELSLSLASAQAEWILQQKYGGNAKALMLSLREQFEACGGDAAVLGDSFNALTEEEKANVARVIVLADSTNDLAVALNSTANAAALAQEQLNTLKGSVVLLQSSVETMNESFGATLAPMLITWYTALKNIVDYISTMHPAIRFLIAIFVTAGGILAAWSGQIMMTAGGIAMLVAALVILTQQRYREMAATVDQLMTTQGLTQAQAIQTVVTNNLVKSQNMLQTSMKMMGLEMKIMAGSMTTYLIPTLKMAAFSLASIGIGMWLVTKGAEDQTRWMQTLGMIMMTVVPMMQMYLVLLKGITLAQIKGAVVNALYKISMLGVAWATFTTGSAFLFLYGTVLPLVVIFLAIFAAAKAITWLFEHWEEVTTKLGKAFEKLYKIFRYVFLLKHSPSFLETLQSSANLARENTSAFRAWSSTLSGIKGRTIGGRAEFGVGAGGSKQININIMSGSRISLTKEAMPKFEQILNKVKAEVLEEVSNLI
jgi:TP901 family phage tail tape measure protein